jgi:vacuolar-type H+-ATPase subunit E/Vma4
MADASNRTTIQVSEDLRKKLRILASVRDVSYEQLLEEMIDVFKEIDKSKTVVSIPKKLADRVSTLQKNTDFESSSAYITHILREIIGHAGDGKMTKEDEGQIKKRLKYLGYI